MKKFLVGLGAAALIAGQSVVVAAAPAPVERASATIAGEAEASGAETYLVVALVLAAAFGAVLAMSDDDDDQYPAEPYPTSP